MATKFNITSILVRRGNNLRCTHRRDGRMEVAAETGVVYLPTNGGTASNNGRTASSSQNLEEVRMLPWDFHNEHYPASTLILPASLQDGERINFCCFKQLSHSNTKKLKYSFIYFSIHLYLCISRQSLLYFSLAFNWICSQG